MIGKTPEQLRNQINELREQWHEADEKMRAAVIELDVAEARKYKLSRDSIESKMKRRTERLNELTGAKTEQSPEKGQ